MRRRKQLRKKYREDLNRRLNGRNNIAKHIRIRIKGMISAYMWGYPRGGLPGGKSSFINRVTAIWRFMPPSKKAAKPVASSKTWRYRSSVPAENPKTNG